MKSFGAFVLSLAAPVIAVSIDRRQVGQLGQLGPLGNLPNLLGSMKLPTVKAVRIESPEPVIPGSDIKRVRMTYGPYKLKASNSKNREGNFISLDPQGTGWAYVASDFPTDITILTAKMTIGYDDGKLIGNTNGVYNHHAFFLDLSRGFTSRMACQSNSFPLPSMNLIMGSAADSVGMNLTATRPITGNFIPKGNKILLTGDLVNYNNQTKEVFMTADVQYIEGKAPGYLETSVHLIPVGACESKFFGLEAMFARPPRDKKQWSIKGAGLTVQEDGKLILVKGHLHDGGVNMVFRLNDKEFCNSKAEYNAGSVGNAGSGHGHGGGQDGQSDDGGMLSAMLPCINNVDVKKGDQISVEAFYDVEKHPAREHPGGGMSEAMALAVVIFGKEIK